MRFYKMQGLGNDYVYVNCFEYEISDPEALSVRVSDRHFGIGSDGLILLCPSSVADFKMRIFNADGSEAMMCGNGIRCLGKLAYMLGICKKEIVKVETASGIRTLRFVIVNGSITGICVDMGAPVLDKDMIPVIALKNPVIDYPVNIGGKGWGVTCVSMGNPHAVVFTKNIDAMKLENIGPLFERHEMFPHRVNTEFVEVLGPAELRMRVWERGSGETMACGTGACAVAVAACLNGICRRGEEIAVHLRGGDLRILWDDETVYMTGPAELSFTGDIEL